MQTRTARRSRPANLIHDDTFTNGVIGPTSRMLGPLADGGRIVFETAPGCWGPMITPTIRGGHEVCTPVAIEGAEVGDAVALRVEKIRVLSRAASVGVDESREGCFIGDPYVAKQCPVCKELWPEFVVEGIARRRSVARNAELQYLHSRWSTATRWSSTTRRASE